MGHAELARQLAGERLNHFQLLEYVGGGGMGAVFRALDTMLNREVALKVLSRDQGADDETRRRFQNEAQSAARLDHENIARVYYVGEDHGLNYIVFEFIEGTNLRDLVERNGPLPLPEALSYSLQVAHALSHAASRDVVHRDIKPSNLIITASGRAKLVDMGLARLHQPKSDGADLTASGVTLGTFDYISPEQARDPRSADVRSDIYSLGCTLYYMLTGRPPFPDGTVLQKLLQHNSDAPPDPREIDPSLPPGVSLLVAKMLAKDPLRRYQQPEAFIADLLVLAEQTGCVLPGVEVPGWAPGTRTASRSRSLMRHLPWMIPVSLLLAATVVADWQLPWIDPTDDVAVLSRLEDRAQRRSAKRMAVPTSDRESAVPDEEEDERVPPKRGEGSAKKPGGDGLGPEAAGMIAPNRTAVGTLSTRTERSESSQTDADLAEPSPPVAGRDGPSTSGSARDASEAPREAAANKREDDPTAEAIPEGLLVVGDRARGPRRFASLAEACAVAKDGDVIELRYDGPREGSALSLHNLRIEIRAGTGRKPAVVFSPNDTNPASTDRTMLAVSGGSLKMSGVELELDLSHAAPSENWSLFTVNQADGVRLDQCLLTIRNTTASGGTYHDRVAFFTVGGAGEPMAMMPQGMPTASPVQIALNKCLARGEADLVVNRDLRMVNFSCTNGLVALSERFFAVGGGTAMPTEGSRMRVDLDHVTVLARHGFCRIAASEAGPGLPEVEVHLNNSVVLSDEPDPSLVEHVAHPSTGPVQPTFHWEATNSVYLGFRTFWTIARAGSSRGTETKGYSEWTELWPAEKAGTRAGPLVWQVPQSRPISSLTADDFGTGLDMQPLLPPSLDSSGRQAGVDFQLLPPGR